MPAPGTRWPFATPTYPYYAKLVELQDARRPSIEFDDDFSLPAALAAARAPLTLVPNPNSPSGTVVSGEDLESLAAEVSGILVVDEATSTSPAAAPSTSSAAMPT